MDAIITPHFLDRLRSTPNLPPHVWYYVTMIALSVLNRPEEISTVWKYTLAHDAIPGSDNEKYVVEERKWLGESKDNGIGRVDEKGRESALRIARRCREGLLKAGGVGGLPKAINSLLALQNSHPPYLLDPLPASPSHPTHRGRSLPLSSNPNVEYFINRGTTFFDKLYGPVGQRIKDSMGTSSPDLQVLAAWMYGLLLSEESVLTGRETGFMMVAALVPQDVNPQLKGHLKGALNHGATREEVMAVREVVMEICRAAGVTWKGEVAKL